MLTQPLGAEKCSVAIPILFLNLLLNYRVANREAVYRNLSCYNARIEIYLKFSAMLGCKVSEALVKDQIVDYYELEAELKKLETTASTEEAHGILVGQLCGGNKLEGLSWLKQYLPDVGVKRDPWDDTREWFYALRKFVLEDLSDPEFSFQLLLPDDDEPLSRRLSAVGEWCSGFLAGFGTTGERDEKQYPDDVRSTFRDFSSISQIDSEVEVGGEDEEEQEKDYFEVVEYIRMATLLVFNEFVGQYNVSGTEGSSEGQTLH